MDVLIGNGSKLYTRARALVRTPIRIHLNPMERAYYPVAGVFNSGGWPVEGFIAQGTYNNVIMVGGNCLSNYGRPTTNKPYFWRKVGDTSGHDPETVWYQGAYATSASSLGLSYASCEAYVQLGAYRFSIPRSFSSLSVKNVTVKFTSGGGVQCIGSPATRNYQNCPLKGYSNFNQWYLPFFVTEILPFPQEYGPHGDPYDAKFDILADTGECRAARDLWVRNSSNMDGGIPTLTNPVSRQYDMGANTLSYVNGHRTFWITPLVDWVYNSSTLGGYAPYYVNTYNGWWGCISLWGLSVDVELGAPS